MPPKLSSDLVSPVLRKSLPGADGELIDYLSTLIADSETPVTSSISLCLILNDILVDYDLAKDEKHATSINQSIYQAMVQKGLVKAEALKSVPSKDKQVSTIQSSNKSLNQSKLSDSGDEWDMPQVEIVYRDLWKPAFEPARPRLIVGLQVQARYTDDCWYPAVIDALNQSNPNVEEDEDESIQSNNLFRVRFPDYNNDTVIVGIERIKMKERIAINQSTIDLAAERANEKVEDVDPFEAAFSMKKFDAPRGIQRFGEKVKKAKSVIVEERKEISKRQLKKEAKMKRLAEAVAKREKIRIERATKLQQRALEKYLSSDKSVKVGDIEVEHFSMSTPDGSQELITNSKLKLVQGRKYALIGRNGMGKTTLLRLIANYELFGFPENVRVVHVEQEVSPSSTSVIDLVMAADAERDLLMKEEKELLEMLGIEELEFAKQEAEKVAAERRTANEADRAARASAADAANEDDQNAEESLEGLMNEMKQLENEDIPEENPEENSDDDENDGVDEKLDEDIDDDIVDEPVVQKPAAAMKIRGKSTTAPSAKQTILPPTKEIIPPHIRYQQVLSRLLEIDAYGAEARARAILNGLQFSQSRQNQMTKDLSGGWRMRVAIACALFVAPDLLLLDEPTNHLDWPAVLWLENYLQRYSKTLIVVSHDRSFLDEVSTDVIHLYQRNLHYYRGNYSAFERIRRVKLLQMKREFEAQQMKRAHIEEFIAKFRYNASRAALVQSRIKALQRMDALVEVVEDAAVHFSFPQPDPLTGTLIGIQDVSFGYVKGKTLLHTVNCHVDMDSRVAILGANGVGKSTLLHLMLGRFPPVSGVITRSSAARIATFTQHHIDTLDMHLSPVDAMAKLFPGHPEEHFRRHLGGFGITGKLATQEISSLSGGQKSRVAFATVSWRKPHLIIMDEPTNHLDLETIEALIAAVKAFDGGVICVSHDQHFVTNIANEFWGLNAGKLSRFDSFEQSKKFTYNAS